MYDVVSADAGVADHRPPPSVVQTLPPMPVVGTAAQSEVDVHEMAASQVAEPPGSACGDQVTPPSVLPNTAWVGKSWDPAEPRASHTSADGHEMPMTASRPETTVAFHDAPPSVVERTVGPEPPATQSDAVGQDTVVNAPSTSCDGWLDQSAPPSVELTTVPSSPHGDTVRDRGAGDRGQDARPTPTVSARSRSYRCRGRSPPRRSGRSPRTWRCRSTWSDRTSRRSGPRRCSESPGRHPRRATGRRMPVAGRWTAEVAMAIRATRTSRPTRTYAGRRPPDIRRARRGRPRCPWVQLPPAPRPQRSSPVVRNASGGRRGRRRRPHRTLRHRRHRRSGDRRAAPPAPVHGPQSRPTRSCGGVNDRS